MNPKQPTTLPQPGFAPPLRYAPEVEQVPADEAETIEKIGRMMVGMAEKVQQRHGQAMRATHSKATGLLKGELVVLDDLPAELAQGMFARPGRYDVLVRYSQGPSNPVPDRAAFSAGRFRYFEQRLAFNPIHGLEAHRPLGGVNRARMAAHLQTQDFRQRQDGVSPAEPGSSAEVPD